jgi:hypothetical protein
MNMQLRSLLLKAVPLQYLDEFNDATHGFSRASLQTMLQSLVNAYGKIQDTDLQDNWTKLRAPWNPDTPIIKMMCSLMLSNKCCLFAATEEGGKIMTGMHFIRELIQVFRDSGVLPPAIDDWEAKPRASKTIAVLKTHFTEASQQESPQEQRRPQRSHVGQHCCTNQWGPQIRHQC